MVEPVVIMRRLDRSACRQRGCSIIAVSCAGTSTVSVMRSRSIASMAASGSNLFVQDDAGAGVEAPVMSGY